jgi:hypothetical protein
VPPREFLKSWQQSASLAEVSAEVRRKKNAFRVRAHHCRQLGIPSNELPEVVIEPTDWGELADHAAELVVAQRELMAAGE